MNMEEIIKKSNKEREVGQWDNEIANNLVNIILEDESLK